MLNQFTGIGKVESKISSWNMEKDTYYTLLEVALCTDKDELIFNGNVISMCSYDDDKLKNIDKVEKDDIVAFNGHYENNNQLLILDKINII